MKASLLLRVVVALWTAALLSLQPAPAGAAPVAHEPTFSASLLSPPPPTLCPGDQAAISVFIMDTAHAVPAAGYPVNILQSNPPVGVLDPVSKVITNGTVNFTYKAHDNGAGKGTQTDVLTFTIGGYPTGLSVPVTVADCGDYQFNFLLEQRKTQDFIELYTYISGKSTAARINQQLTGVETGSAQAFLSIGGEANGVVCKLEPSIEGSGVFNTDGFINPQGPGSDLLSLDFTFDAMTFNNALLYCKVMDVMASYPFDVGSWDPDELGLQGLSVPLTNNAGTIPISAQGLSGQLTVRREVKK